MIKVKVEGTIDKRVFEEFKKVYGLEAERAEVEDRVNSSTGNVLEMLLRKKIKAYRDWKKVGYSVACDAAGLFALFSLLV